ncbi:MAG: glycoside hydrolase family 15 protein [Candidatus Nanopelagicales bacterium]
MLSDERHEQPGLRAAPSLRELALIADGERGALLSPGGSVLWMCAPQWHDDAVLSGLIGGPGHFTITPDSHYKPSGTYEEASLVWREDWVTDDGAVRSTSALARPADPRTAVLLRRFEAESHPAVLRLTLDLRPGFGARRLADLHRIDGIWYADAGGLTLRLRGAPDAVPTAERVLEGLLLLEPGDDPTDLVLEIGSGPLGPAVPADELWRRTREEWAGDARPNRPTAAPRDADLAAAVIRGLTSPSGGGMVAAATLGLPERSGGARDYDYRYAWLRDQCVAGGAAGRAGVLDLLDNAQSFVTARLLADGTDTRPAYTVTGGAVPPLSPLPLPGYPGARALTGNGAREQFQLDMFGESLGLLAEAARHGMLDSDGWKAAEIAASAIADRWDERDCGLWELDPQWWTHSRLACVTGLRALARTHWSPAASDRLRSLADTVLHETRRRSLSPDGVWRRTPDDNRVDPALLWPLVRDPEVPPEELAPTLRAVVDQLTDDGYAYRGLGDGSPGDTEGAFMLCGFLVSLAMIKAGDHVTGARWFERNRSACGSPGLFTEEFDVRHRELLGNLPQAFVHALLLDAAGAVGADLAEWGDEDLTGRDVEPVR